MRGNFRKIAVWAPFAAGIGRRPGQAVSVREDLARAASAFGDHCVLEVPRDLIADGRIAVPLRPPAGLTPEVWLPLTPHLAELVESRSYLHSAEVRSETSMARIAEQLRQRWPQLTGSWQQVAAGENHAVGPAHTPLDDLLNLVALPPERDGVHPGPAAAGWRLEIDGRLRALLQVILAHPDYRERTTAWHGLSWLHALGRGSMRFHLVDVDCHHLPELFAPLAEELIREEPDLLLVDLPFDHTPRDLDTLAALAELGDRLLTPVLVWLGPAFFSLSTWRDLPRLPYLTTLMERPQYAKWRSLRAKPEARWLSASVGRFAAAGQDSLCTSLGNAPPVTEPAWIRPVWAIAALVLQQQEESGLPCPITGQAIVPPGSGALELEAVFSEERGDQLYRAGFAPLLAMSANQVGFTVLPLADGTSLDHQLLVRRLLNWLFAEQQQQPLLSAPQLRTIVLAQLQHSGIAPPDEFSLVTENGLLTLTIQLSGKVFPRSEQVVLQLPWETPPLPDGSNHGDCL